MTQYKCFIKNKVENFFDSDTEYSFFNRDMQSFVSLQRQDGSQDMRFSYGAENPTFLDLDDQTLQEIANYLDQKKIPHLTNNLMNSSNADTYLQSHILDPNPYINYRLNLFQHLFTAKKIKKNPPWFKTVYFGYSNNDPVYKFLKKNGIDVILDPNFSIKKAKDKLAPCSSVSDCKSKNITLPRVSQMVFSNFSQPTSRLGFHELI